MSIRYVSYVGCGQSCARVPSLEGVYLSILHNVHTLFMQEVRFSAASKPSFGHFWSTVPPTPPPPSAYVWLWVSLATRFRIEVVLIRLLEICNTARMNILMLHWSLL